MENVSLFEVLREDDRAVVVKDSDLNENLLVSCGDDNVEVSFPVHNVGLDKEENVLVNLYNSQLGIDEFFLIDNLNEGRQKEVTFFKDIPDDVDLERYNLKIYTYFDYDDGDEEDIVAYRIIKE